MTLAVLGVSMSGCGATTGEVVGEYRLVGGPGGISRIEPGTVWAFRGRISWLALSASPPAAHANTDAKGRFTLLLPPGEYTLFAAAGLSTPLGADTCGGPVFVEVTAASHHTAELVCSVP